MSPNPALLTWPRPVAAAGGPPVRVGHFAATRDTSGVGSLTLDTSSATPGNLLVVFAAVRQGSGVASPDLGAAMSPGIGSNSIAPLFGTADGAANSITVTWTPTGTDRAAMIAVEYADANPGSVNYQDDSNLTQTVVTTTHSSGFLVGAIADRDTRTVVSPGVSVASATSTGSVNVRAYLHVQERPFATSGANVLEWSGTGHMLAVEVW